LQRETCCDETAIAATVHERHVGHLHHNDPSTPGKARPTHEVASGQIEFATDLHDSISTLSRDAQRK
jgi:hypothetical protein